MNISFKDILHKAIESEWAIAYRNKRNGEILTSKKQYFTIIKNTLRYWCADPFVVEEGTKIYVFFEVFDRIRRKGVIGYREISSNRIGKINIIIEEPFHLSYPYIYRENGSWYIIPESKDLNKIIRYKSKKFPDIWEKEKILIDNISAVDTIVFNYCKNDMKKNDIKLFTYIFESFNKGKLQIFHLKDNYQTIISSIKDPDGRKRPAGRICMIDNIYYRPSQLCTKAYGEAIIFNKILCLTDNSYEETEYKIITIEDICLDRAVKITGVHTYNNSENWEVVDVEISGVSLIRIIGLIPRIYHIAKRTIKAKKMKGNH
ncbi:MAG: hypothetical protein PHR60_01925 [Eubacteriales bacterium]|nr:hypothetical protein [Eubacteriales bacterium]